MEENSFVVRFKTSDYLVGSISSIFLIVVFCMINKDESMPAYGWFCIVILGIFFLITQYLYWGKYLKFDNDQVKYRNGFRKRIIQITDIKCIKMEYSQTATNGILVLCDHYDEEIFRCTKNTNNFEKIVPHIKKYINIDVSIPDSSFGLCDNSEYLVIKPTKLYLINFYFSILVLILFVLSFIIGVILEGIYLLFIYLICLIILIMPIMFFGLKINEDIKFYKNFKLVLTKELCYVIDVKGRKTEFLLNDINIIKIEHIYRRGTYLKIKLFNNDVIPPIPYYDKYCKNVKLIIPYAEKNLNRVICEI